MDRQRKHRRREQVHTPPTHKPIPFLIYSSSIMNYLQETVSDNHLEHRIALGVRVAAADWDSTTRAWNLILTATQENGEKNERRLRCSILYMCSGYFSYDTPHDPKFPGFEKFRGVTLHPQFWPSPCPALRGKQVLLHGCASPPMPLLPCNLISA